MTVIEARAMVKRYGRRTAVDDLSLTVAAGEVVALVGENGAGKTTALGMLSGQIVPDSGSAKIAGHDVYQAPCAARRQLGFVAQDLLLPPHLTLCEMAEFACQVKNIPLVRRDLDQLLAITDLSEDADRLLGELSYGMQRKAAWVVALVTHPTALLLDEGLAGLDATSREGLFEETARRLADGIAILWTEHDLSPVVNQLARVVVMHRGKVTETVSGSEIRTLAQTGEIEETMRRWTSY